MHFIPSFSINLVVFLTVSWELLTLTRSFRFFVSLDCTIGYISCYWDVSQITTRFHFQFLIIKFGFYPRILGGSNCEYLHLPKCFMDYFTRQESIPRLMFGITGYPGRALI